MYKGSRDVPILLVVPQSFCFDTVFDNEERWIEVFTPPKFFSVLQNPWGSFVVKPSQVYYCKGLHNVYNTVFLNSGSRISLYYKIDDPVVGRRKLVGQEKIYTDELVSRFLQYELACQFGIPPQIDTCLDWINSHFAQSGYTMERYIEKIHDGSVFS